MNRKLPQTILLHWLLLLIDSVARTDPAAEDYQNEWVVRVEGGAKVASFLASKSGYRYLAPVLGFEDTYIWIKEEKPAQKKRGSPLLTRALNSSAEIIWADRQKVVRRDKRDYVSLDAAIDAVASPLNAFAFPMDDRYGNFESEYEKQRILFDDELWDQQWYLQDTRTRKDLPKLHLNVLPLYRLGVTGKGVRVAVLDDGLEYTHEDLRNNYEPEISYNVNAGNFDPMPRYDGLTETNSHGTRCAGEIAMQANNGKCGVGVAFGASVGGIKLLDGTVSDRVEGEALAYKSQMVDIYTASWGPPDDGKSLDAPGRLALEALQRGVTEGRNGKGNIYVWASGNGGSNHDNCGCDGYVGSIYTIAIGSASQTGRSPWYGEKCPAVMATTYSSGAYYDQMIVTTDLLNSCTTKHTGTSASAPLAAGIIALALEVNADLTWRDVQHLIVRTSEHGPLRYNSGWFKNAAGFWFNSHFGFGLMNAYKLVMAAYNWTTVPAKRICDVPLEQTYQRNLTTGISRTLQFDVANECREEEGREILFLEHVEMEVSLEYTFRGALRMQLTAPSGTTAEILSPRKLDDSDAGFEKWRFMAVAYWGEDPRGIWRLNVSDEICHRSCKGKLKELKLTVHGTAHPPFYRKYGPRIYDYGKQWATKKASPFFDDSS